MLGVGGVSWLCHPEPQYETVVFVSQFWSPLSIVHMSATFLYDEHNNLTPNV